MGAGREWLRARVIHFEQSQRGEIADDVIDLRMERQPVEQGQVEGETGTFAPGCQDFGKSGQQNPGRG